MEWNATYKTDGYLSDQRLKNGRSFILVTYETNTGRRYVKQVECLHGRISKRLPGKIVAWMPLPKPYTGNALESASGLPVVRCLADI